MLLAMLSLTALLILPILFIYSLLKPKAFSIRTMHNPTGKISRSKFSIALIAVWITTVIAGVTLSTEQNTAIENENEAIEIL